MIDDAERATIQVTFSTGGEVVAVLGAVRSGRQGGVEHIDRGLSRSGVRFRFERVAPLDRPVDLAVTLRAFGLSLRHAHAALDAFVADRSVILVLQGASSEVVAAFADLGVAARPAQPIEDTPAFALAPPQSPA